MARTGAGRLLWGAIRRERQAHLGLLAFDQIAQFLPRSFRDIENHAGVLQTVEGGIVMVRIDDDVIGDRHQFFEHPAFGGLVQGLARLPKDLLLQQRVGQRREDDLVHHQIETWRGERGQVPEAFQVAVAFFNEDTQVETFHGGGRLRLLAGGGQDPPYVIERLILRVAA